MATQKWKIHDSISNVDVTDGKLKVYIGNTTFYPEVANFAALPAAGDHSGEIYIVKTGSGAYIVARKSAGMYISDGATWSRLGNIPAYFSDLNVQVYNETDPTKIMDFDSSNITTGNDRTLIMADRDVDLTAPQFDTVAIGTATVPAGTKLNIDGGYDGIQRVTLENTSTASAAVVGSIYEAKNDSGYWGAIGITNSGSTILGGTLRDTYQNYSQGYGDFLFTNDGNVDFRWFSDPTDSHNFSALNNEIMKLEADGTLIMGNGEIVNNSSITLEPTGFTDPDGVIVTGDSTTRTVTLTGTVEAYYQSILVTELVSGWTSPAHNNVTTEQYFLAYDGSFSWIEVGSLGEEFYTKVLIAFAFYDSTNSTWVYLRESHGFMGWENHREFHQTTGTYRRSGGDLQNYTLDSTTAADRRPDVEATLLYDEDLPTTNPVLNTSSYSNFYLSGAGADVNTDISQADIVPLSTARPYWNEFTGGAWQQTLMSNNHYMAIWVLCIPMAAETASQHWRYLWVQGQTESNDLETIQARTPQDISIGTLRLLLPELVVTNKVIIQYTAGDWKIIQVDSVTGTSSSQTTSPSGNYLTSVTHDSTMTGQGTTAVPLSIGQAVTTIDSPTFNAITITEDIKINEALAADGDYSGMTCAGVLGATLAIGDLVYLQTSDQRWEATDADAEATSGDVMIGLVLVAGDDGDATTILLKGFIRVDAWNFTSYGKALYVDVTAGDMSVTAPSGTGDIVRVAGYAHDNADTIYFDPSKTYIEIA